LNNSNLVIPGCLLLGLGIGIAVDKTYAGMFIGLGGGFLLSALITLIASRSKKEKQTDSVDSSLD
jgi:ribose 5-phosphate isomerase